MCVIAVYKKGIEFDYDELRNCFYGNPDGAGYMYPTHNGVQIRKGFMDVESLIDELKKLPKDVDRVVHFRIATTGKISGATCHPFPVVKSFKLMGKEKSHATMGVAHNGILKDFEPIDKMKAEYSDTMNFVRTILCDMQKKGMIHTESGKYLIDKALSTDKLAIMTKDDLQLHGDWQASKKSGAMYSNSSYLSYSKYFWGYESCGYTNSTGTYQERTLLISPAKGKEYFTAAEFADTLSILESQGYILDEDTLEYSEYCVAEDIMSENETLYEYAFVSAYSDFGWYISKLLPCEVEVDYYGGDEFELV